MTNIAMSELLITDGTRVVDLLNHFRLLSWTPVETPIRDGGIFQESPIADGRRMVSKYYANGGETFTLAVKTGHQNAAINDLRRLRAMFEESSDYWTNNWADGMVWIEARSGQETNRRYAIIMAGSIPNDPPPYSEPFASRLQTMGVVEVTVERGHWLDVRPGTDTAISSYAIDYYPTTDVIGYGNTDAISSVLGNVWMGNGRLVSNIDYICFSNDGTNVIDALPLTLFQAGQYTYFGIQETNGGISNPILPDSLVFDIDSPGIAGKTVIWEYWKEATSSWVAVTPYLDGTNQFNNDGINQICFFSPESSSTGVLTNLGGFPTTPTSPIALPSGQWWRASMTSPDGNYPIQTNRRVYTVSWGHIDIDNTQIGGDIPALIRATLASGSKLTPTQFDFGTIYIASRSLSRGDDYTPYILLSTNFNSDIPNPIFNSTRGISVAIGSTMTEGVDIISNNQFGYPYYRVVQIPNTAINSLDKDIFVVNIDSYISNQYRGKFRAFLRYTADKSILSTNNAYVSLRVSTNDIQGNAPIAGPSYKNTDDVSLMVDGTSKQILLLDMGAISLLESADTDDNYNNLLSFIHTVEITVHLKTGTFGAGSEPNLYFAELILLPADELFVETRASDNIQLEVSSTKNPRKTVYTIVRKTEGASDILYTANSISNGPITLQKQSAQRIWALSYALRNNSMIVKLSPPTDIRTVQISKQQRYKSMRGDS